VDHHVCVLLEDLPGIGGDGNAPRGIRGSDNFAEVAAGFGRVHVNRADDVNGLLLAHESCNGRADGPHTVLNGANLFFHEVLRLLAVHLAAEETPTIMDFAQRFNEEAARADMPA